MSSCANNVERINIKIDIEDNCVSKIVQFKDKISDFKFMNNQNYVDYDAIVSLKHNMIDQYNIDSIDNDVIIECNNNITQLWMTLFGNENVVRKSNDIRRKCVDYNLIDLDVLQSWVNVYHNKVFESTLEKMIIGFILYYMYIRVSPHEHSNELIATYLFLENNKMINTESDVYTSSYVPISSIKQFNFPRRILDCLHDSAFKSIDEESGYDDIYRFISVDECMLNYIHYLIYTSLLFNSVEKNVVTVSKSLENLLFRGCTIGYNNECKNIEMSVIRDVTGDYLHHVLFITNHCDINSTKNKYNKCIEM